MYEDMVCTRHVLKNYVGSLQGDTSPLPYKGGILLVRQRDDTRKRGETRKRRIVGLDFSVVVSVVVSGERQARSHLYYDKCINGSPFFPRPPRAPSFFLHPWRVWVERRRVIHQKRGGRSLRGPFIDFTSKDPGWGPGA